jgi:hypothetical protein
MVSAKSASLPIASILADCALASFSFAAASCALRAARQKMMPAVPPMTPMMPTAKLPIFD